MRLKLYGLERTCTNITRWLVNENTSARVFHGPGPSFPEWKHGDPVRSDYDGYLLCFKEPLAWLASIARREGPNPLAQIKRWSVMNRRYLEFAGDDSFIVRHEDVIEHPEDVIRGIAETFGVTYTLPIRTQPNAMHRGGDGFPVEVTRRPFDHDYYRSRMYLCAFDPDVIVAVRAAADPWVMRELGYEERV